MKRFLAIYMGTATRARARSGTSWTRTNAGPAGSGLEGLDEWGAATAAAIVDQGGPLGKTKRASKQGVADFKNSMTGYAIVQAESHAAAAKMFENHPHFTIFPGDSVEIMECLPLPGQ